MPGFEIIIGQKRPVRLLQTFLQNATLPHALIFSGISGIGKRTVAKILAMALNCQTSGDKTNPCGQCPVCRQILAGSHPDVIMTEPQGNYIRIDQIRDLLHVLAMKPCQADQRVVIIADAQAMNKEAANALLKVLEEPPANTTIILTVLQRSDLLPTIVSRCRHIRFDPLAVDDIISLMEERSEADDPYVKTAAALAGGSLSKANMLATAAWREQRNWIIRAAGLDQSASGDRRSLTLALAFAAQLARKKDQLTALLEILKTWIRDLSIWPYYPQSVINGDYREVLERVRPSMDDAQLLSIWHAVEKAQKDIAAKANMRLTLDVMALGMAGYELGCF